MTFDNLDDYIADQRDNERMDEPSAEYQRGYNERKLGGSFNPPPAGFHWQRQYRAGWAAADYVCRPEKGRNA